jgi:hypothetical protein
MRALSHSRTAGRGPAFYFALGVMLGFYALACVHEVVPSFCLPLSVEEARAENASGKAAFPVHVGAALKLDAPENPFTLLLKSLLVAAAFLVFFVPSERQAVASVCPYRVPLVQRMRQAWSLRGPPITL